MIVVGGSGFYLRVLRGGIFAGPAAAPEVRRELEALAAEHGVEYLHARLHEVDAPSAERIGHRDLYRIVRALEVFRLTGYPISAHQQSHRFAAREYETLTVGLAMERKRLYESINRRFDEMVARGLVDEVRALLGAGCDPGKAPLKTVGYRQIAAAVRGEMTLAEAMETRQARHAPAGQAPAHLVSRRPEIVWVDAERGLQEALRVARCAFFARRAGGEPLKSEHPLMATSTNSRPRAAKSRVGNSAAADSRRRGPRGKRFGRRGHAGLGQL